MTCITCGKRLTALNRAWGTHKCGSCAKGRSSAAKAIAAAERAAAPPKKAPHPGVQLLTAMLVCLVFVGVAFLAASAQHVLSLMSDKLPRQIAKRITLAQYRRLVEEGFEMPRIWVSGGTGLDQLTFDLWQHKLPEDTPIDLFSTSVKDATVTVYRPNPHKRLPGLRDYMGLVPALAVTIATGISLRSIIRRYWMPQRAEQH